jgi:hypothetical protein
MRRSCGKSKFAWAYEAVFCSSISLLSAANANGAPVGRLLQLYAATALRGMEAMVRSTFYRLPPFY